MNAAVERISEQTLKDLFIDCLRVSTTNPRRSFDAANQAELAASIAQVGVQVPLLVRPWFDSTGQSDGEYEIVAGERRFRAAQSLGLETAPCLVREMTDEEAREIQIVENLQRADVSPLEEAEAFQAMLVVHGSIASVAARFGKEESYVAKCLRLNSLTLASRDALRGRLIGLDHALLLARLAEAEQNAALKWCLDRNAGVKTPVEKVIEDRFARIKQEEDERKEEDEDSDGKGGGRRFFTYRWEPQSVVQLKSWIEAKSGTLLSRAPWPLDDDSLLADVPACSECPKNTRANVPLFGDLEMGEATCTDGNCFQAKTAGFVRIAIRQQPINIMQPRLSWKASSVKPSIAPNELKQPGSLPEIANPAKVLKQGQWIEAKAGSCTNLRSGVTVDWSDDGNRGYVGRDETLRKPGELLKVCIAVGCKAHPKAWEKAERSASAEKKGLSYEEQRKLEEVKEKAYVAAEAPVRRAVYEAVKAKVKLDADGMLRALMFAGFGGGNSFGEKAFCDVRGIAYTRGAWGEVSPALRNELPKLSGADLVSAAFDAICARYTVPNESMHASRKQDRKAMWDWAQRHGVDAEAIAKTFEAKQPKPAAAKKAAAKKASAKKAAPVKKGQKSRPAKLSPEARKRVQESLKKHLADARKAAAKKAAAKKASAKKAAPVKKGQKSRPAKLSPEARKRVQESLKKHLADARKAAAKKGAAKKGAA